MEKETFLQLEKDHKMAIQEVKDHVTELEKTIFNQETLMVQVKQDLTNKEQECSEHKNKNKILQSELQNVTDNLSCTQVNLDQLTLRDNEKDLSDHSGPVD
jgi:chromosome segregation ATPase